MLNIIWMLFVAWFLNLFGFGNTVITGLAQWGGPELTMTGYYFAFAAVGLLKNVIEKFHFSSTVKLAIKELEDKIR